MAVPPFQFKFPSADITFLGSFPLVAQQVFEIRDLVNPVMQGVQATVQSIWCDASRALGRVNIFNRATGQVVRFPPGYIGWKNFFVKDDIRFDILTGRSTTIELAVSSAIIPSDAQEGGDLAPIAASRSFRDDVPASVNSQEILPANDIDRLSYSIFHDPGATPSTLYILEHNIAAASPTNYTLALPSGGFMSTRDEPQPYVNQVRAVWDIAEGVARVTVYRR